MTSTVSFVLIAFVGVGLIAGLFLDVVGFLVLVVLPTIGLLACLAVFWDGGLAWYVYPALWAAQQLGYLGVILLVRPAYHRVLLGRVKRMGALLSDLDDDRR